MDKNSSLFGQLVSYEENEVLWIRPMDLSAEKLEDKVSSLVIFDGAKIGRFAKLFFIRASFSALCLKLYAQKYLYD
jgi:hypothetical protein